MDASLLRLSEALLPTNTSELPFPYSIAGNQGPLRPSHALPMQLSRSMAVVSMLCVGIILVTFCAWKRFRTPANRVILFMSIADLVSAAAMFLGGWTVYQGPLSPSCSAQAILLQWGDLASVLWSAAMACNLLMVLFLTRSARDLAALEKHYFFFCFGLSFIVALVPVFLSSETRGLIYGPSHEW
jgi:hypothetical protein